jgi:hypothetical protein
MPGEDRLVVRCLERDAELLLARCAACSATIAFSISSSAGQHCRLVGEEGAVRRGLADRTWLRVAAGVEDRLGDIGEQPAGDRRRRSS